MHDILERLLANILFDSPSREDMSLVKYCLHLLNRASLGLREHEDYVNACNKVERRKQEVSAVGDVGQSGRDGPCECSVESPVRGCRERDSLAADAGWEDFGGAFAIIPCVRTLAWLMNRIYSLGPRSRTNGNGKGADKQIRSCDDGLACGLVPSNDPSARTIDIAPVIDTLVIRYAFTLNG